MCDRDFFRLLYRLDMRRSERTGRVNPLGLLTLTRKDYGLPGSKTLDNAIGHLKRVLLLSLRKCDVICQWNQAQVVILFSDLDYSDAETVLRRIKEDFSSKYQDRDIVLRGQIQPLFPWP